MDTIATIINSIPEPLATAIITGIVIFFLQKRMENSFAEKLETFKTNLQSSLFEHQTAFSRTYLKRGDSLEALYQKFVNFSEDFKRICFDVTFPYGKSFKEEPNITPDDYQNCETKLNDFWQDFTKNRLYLPSELVFEISEIYWYSKNILSLLLLIIPSNKFDADLIKFIMNTSLRETPLNENMVNWEKPDFSFLLTQMIIQIELQVQKLDRLYKLAIEAKNEEH